MRSCQGRARSATPLVTMVTEKLSKRKYPLGAALEVAGELVERLAPSCARVAIAGSVRRKVPMVGDVEILAVPALGTSLHHGQTSLFGTRLPPASPLNLLDRQLNLMLAEGTLELRLNKNGNSTYGPLNKLLVHRESGIPVDIFTATLENWGMALMVRTGPKDWNIKFMAQFRRLGLKGHAYGGVSTHDVMHPAGYTLPCPTEEDVFRLLRWPYREPQDRA